MDERNGADVIGFVCSVVLPKIEDKKSKDTVLYELHNDLHVEVRVHTEKG